MAWRPRKSFHLGKGFRINLSRRGIGWSVGIPKLFRFGIGADRRVRSSFGSGLLRHEFDHGRAAGGHDGGPGGGCGCLAFFLVSVLALILFVQLSGGRTSIPDAEPSASTAHRAPSLSKPEQFANSAEMGGLRTNNDPGQRPATAPVTIPPARASTPSPATATDVEATEALRIPTRVRTWRSSDGRTLEGRIIAINPATDTVTLERADGQVFHGVPLSRLHPEEASRLRASNSR